MQKTLEVVLVIYVMLHKTIKLPQDTLMQAAVHMMRLKQKLKCSLI